MINVHLTCNCHYFDIIPGIILCMHPANERWHYTVTPSLIGWVQIQNDPWYTYIPFLQDFAKSFLFHHNPLLLSWPSSFIIKLYFNTMSFTDINHPRDSLCMWNTHLVSIIHMSLDIIFDWFIIADKVFSIWQVMSKITLYHFIWTNDDLQQIRSQDSHASTILTEMLKDINK